MNSFRFFIFPTMWLTIDPKDYSNVTDIKRLYQKAEAESKIFDLTQTLASNIAIDDDDSLFDIVTKLIENYGIYVNHEEGQSLHYLMAFKFPPKKSQFLLIIENKEGKTVKSHEIHLETLLNLFNKEPYQLYSSVLLVWN